MADTEAASVVVAIDGWSEQKCAQLRGVKVGDWLEIAFMTPPTLVHHEKCNEEGESAADSSGGDGSSSEQSEDEEQVKTPDDTLLADEPDKHHEPLSGSHDLAVHMPQPDRSVTHHVNDTTTEALHLENSDSGPNGDDSGSVTENVDATGMNAHKASNGAAYGQLSSESEDVDERSSDMQQEDGDEDGEAESDSEGDGEARVNQPARMLSRRLYAVMDIVSEFDGDETVITDVQLRPIRYQARGEDSTFDSFRIYGNAVTLADADSRPTRDEEELESIAAVVAAESENVSLVTLNPNGGYIRRTLFNSVCPGQCNRGWLPDQNALQEVLDDDLQALRHYRPVCPVCLGKDLFDEQMALRGFMDQLNIVDLGMVVEFFGRLNTRRREIGYHFVQFDEREWGYGFNDMLDESDSERDDEDDAARYEQWDEAMDPNANAKTRPASKETLAALPRKMYAEVATKVDDAFCVICQQGAFVEETAVVELPCGHVYDEGCLAAWISQYDNCPECRATVSGMVGTNESEVEGTDQAPNEDEDSPLQPAATSGNDEHAVVDTDDEDTVMSDAD